MTELNDKHILTNHIFLGVFQFKNYLFKPRDFQRWESDIIYECQQLPILFVFYCMLIP